MKVEFYSKYGAIAQLAILSKKPMLAIVSGEFAQPDDWAFLDEHHVQEEENESLIGNMLCETGLVIAEFEELAHIDDWIGRAHNRHMKIYPGDQPPHAMLIVFDPDGNIVAEHTIADFPVTPQPIKDEPNANEQAE